jgi:hypothetical protein
MSHYFDGPSRLPRDPDGPRFSTTQALTFFLSAISGVMLFFAVPNLVHDSGQFSTIKTVLLSVGGMTVAYGVNKLGVERGAPLAAIGYKSAALVSVASIALVGVGLFATTFSGLVLNEVSTLVLASHGTELAAYVNRRANAAAEATRIAPVMKAMVSDFAAKRECEIRSSCLSGRTNGGKGPVAKILEEKLSRVEGIAAQTEQGDVVRREALKRLNELVTAYHAALRSEDSVNVKRGALEKIDAEIRQEAGALDQAVPVSLLKAYAAELAQGAEDADRSEASRSVAALLRSEAASLKSVLASIRTDGAEPPPFPSPTGVSDTFNYFGHFLPIAAIAGVVELVFPMTLLIYTFLLKNWELYKTAPTEPRRPHRDDVRARVLLDHPAFTSTKPAVEADDLEDEDDEVPQTPRRRQGRAGKRP